MTKRTKDRNTTKIVRFPYRTDPEALSLRAHRSRHVQTSERAQEYVNLVVNEGLMTEDNESDVRAACWAIASYVLAGGDVTDYALELERVVVIGGTIYVNGDNSES